MSMNSAFSLSFQNIILIGFIYIYIYIYIIIYFQYAQQKLFQGEINAIGEPTSQVNTNWDTTRGTPLGQRGATRDKSPGTEV